MTLEGKVVSTTKYDAGLGFDLRRPECDVGDCEFLAFEGIGREWANEKKVGNEWVKGGQGNQRRIKNEWKKI